MISLLLGTVALLQQSPYQGATTPPSGDTVGYWQQRVGYTIVATLDEAASKLHARATLVYVNNSPDTLREMYVHQYLNAFRPGSKWSATDEREYRARFQDLRDPDYGYERFTAAPTVNGTGVRVDYPGAPDSTVAHFRLPAGLAPHDSIRVVFEWDARPSTVPRRQGRKGRTFDFAQWYPKVAVYDRGGWEPNALVPAGELYGEYGTYDVTMVVRDDQVLASTGVPVSGDPGWARVSRTGPPRLNAEAYASIAAAPAATVPDGFRAVRFIAENVHHFAWSASPDYRYEGGVYARSLPRTRFQTWDTVAVHVLYKAQDDTSWGGGRAVDRTIIALQWLESIWGPYAYPQLTNVHRLDEGGTEFPMMIMDGSASQGLILHEAGHVFTYGILGNNEWRSGWLDEGLTSYQTSWAQKLTPQERAATAQEPPLLPSGYRVNGATVAKPDSLFISQFYREVHGRAEPIGTTAAGFSEFGIYNDMIYDRAEIMYGHLRDVMGDSVFRVFLRDYYAQWALKHVDERAMRTSAEAAYGKSLVWFFDQWIRGTGLLDYAYGGARTTAENGRFVTVVRVERRGELRHAMPVGVLTSSGWTIVHGDPHQDIQDVNVTTTERPQRIELDPNHVTWDWDRRNNAESTFLISIPEPRITYNWPYLDQIDLAHTVVAIAPALWYSGPQGPVFGVRAKTNYLSTVDIHDGGFAFSVRNPHDSSGHTPNIATHLNVWARAENLTFPSLDRPLMGYGGGINYVDGLFKVDLFKKWDLSPFVVAPGPTINVKAYATLSVPSDTLLVPEQWIKATVMEAGGTALYRTSFDADSGYSVVRGALGLGLSSGTTPLGRELSRGYLRAEGSIGGVRPIVGTMSQFHLRFFGGIANNTPRQRAVFASSQNPFETFNNDLFRARGALLKRPGINYLPLGGAALRGFGYNVPLDHVLSGNAEFVQRLISAKGAWGRGTVSLSLFGDGGIASSEELGLDSDPLVDAGAGLIARGRLYDRDVYIRLDAPVFVNRTSLAGGRGLGGNGSFAPRWTLTVGDLWW